MIWIYVYNAYLLRASAGTLHPKLQAEFIYFLSVLLKWLYSPLPHSLSYHRNQFKIALSWWARKKDKITGLKGQIKRLTDNISTLEEEVRISTDYISQLEA
jgi:hypothetical protein